MSNQPPNPRRRALFTLFTDRQKMGEIGAQLGRAVRELSEAASAVPLEQYQEAEAQVTKLEIEMTTLKQEYEEALDAQRSELQDALSQEEVQRLALQKKFEMMVGEAAERDKKIIETLEFLRNSPVPTDSRQAQRWEALHIRLWIVLSGLGGALSLKVGDALFDAFVQDKIYTLIMDLPEYARSQWQQLFSPTLQPGQPLSPLTPPAPVSPLPAQTAKSPTLVSAYTDQLVPEIVRIPSGWFIMGSDKQVDSLARDNETPQHQIHLKEYCIGKYPVTNAQYKRFVDASRHRAPSHWQNGIIPSGIEAHPVTHVSWHDAQAYCRWLSVFTGTLYRLPSEAEWEKAARGTDGRIYPWGNEDPTDLLCNFKSNVGSTTAVGIYPAGVSPYEVYDMAGNVWEWTSSLWGHDYPYVSTDGRENSEAPDNVGRVVRGGAFSFNRIRVRCAYRHWNNPNDAWNYFGFRVVSPGC